MIPFFLLPLRLVKKLTVIGIIGNTHGVSSARNPPSMPAIKIPQKERSAVEPEPSSEIPHPGSSVPSAGILEVVIAGVSNGGTCTAGFNESVTGVFSTIKTSGDFPNLKTKGVS